MPDYIIRKASQEDMESIIDLCEAHALYEGCHYNRPGKLENLGQYLFEDNPCVKCLILELRVV